MDELARPSRHVLEPARAATHCGYCGAALDARYYFCLHCATPYKSVEAVLPLVRVAQPTEADLVRRKAPHVWPLFWTYVAVVVGTAVLCYALFQEREPALKLAIMSVALFVTTCIFAAMHWPSLLVQLKRGGFLHPAAWIGVLALAPLLSINYAYHDVIIRGLGLRDALPTGELRQSGVGEGLLIFLFCVLPGVLEELSFRGLVQHWLQVAISPVRAMVLASALFTALHFSAVSAPYLFAVGMLLGWVKWKTGSLYPSMLIHFAHNFVVLEFFWR